MPMPKEAAPRHNPIQRGKHLNHLSLDEEAAVGQRWGKRVVKADRAARAVVTEAATAMEAVIQVRSSLPSTRITSAAE